MEHTGGPRYSRNFARGKSAVFILIFWYYRSLRYIRNVVFFSFGSSKNQAVHVDIDPLTIAFEPIFLMRKQI